MSDSTSEVSPGQPADEREALAVLVQIAGRRTFAIPATLLARHALALPGPWDWPVRRAALEAILRRLASARAQEIVVVKSPRRNPAVLEQRIGRIHRLGQKRPIDVYNFVSRASIEERIAGLVGDKRALFKGLFDGTTDQVKFAGSGALREILARLTSESAALDARAVAASDDSLDAESSERAEDVALAQLADETSTDRSVVPTAAATPAGQSATSPQQGEVWTSQEVDVGRLLATVTVERAADGAISLKAPPAAASALVLLFEGMARLLRPQGP